MKDFYKDFGYNFIKMFKDKEVPNFVKEAESLEPDSMDSLPDSAFADVGGRTLPITDAANVYVSAAYYYGANDKNASVEERIQKAAALFDIVAEVKDLADYLAKGEEKTASEDETPGQWHVTVESCKGTHAASGSGFENLVKFAGIFAEDLFGLMSFAQKVEGAQKIANEMEKLGGDIPSRILEVAGRNIPDTEKLAQQIKARAVRVSDDDLKVELCKLADDLFYSGDKTMDGMFKVAEILSKIDAQHSLARFYGKSIQDPFASVFNTPHEAAVKLASIVELGDKCYSTEELGEISLDVLKVALSDEAQRAIGLGTGSFDPAKIASLDDSEKAILASYL